MGERLVRERVGEVGVSDAAKEVVGSDLEGVGKHLEIIERRGTAPRFEMRDSRWLQTCLVSQFGLAEFS